MLFRQLFDSESSTYTYLLADEKTNEAILIDPVRELAERDLTIIDELGLKLVNTLETHVHADHIAGSGVLRQRTGSRSIMSEDAGAKCADIMLGDGDTVDVGSIHIEGRKTPGHTEGCMTFLVSSEGEPLRVFTGDTLLIRGCGRTDFQGGDAGTLYDSVREKIFSLPNDALIYPAHDYKGRTMSTVGEEREHNARLRDGIDKSEFIEIMGSLNLAQPKKIDVAVPANLACGLSMQSAGAPEPSWAPVERRDADNAPEVSIEWTRSTLGEFRLIDVRETEELEGELGKIEGCEHVPLATVDEASEDWRSDEPLIVYCRSGNRSAKAALLLEEKGFSRVASMRGGMLEWNASQGTGDGCG